MSLQITNPSTAHAAGKLAAALGMPTYDLTGEMDKRRIPVEFRGAWLNGVEDSFEGYWEVDETTIAETRALAGAYAS